MSISRVFMLFLVAAFVPAQEEVAVPADPFAALEKMSIQPSESKGDVLTVLDAAGRPLAGVSVLYYVGTEPGMPKRTSRAFRAILEAGVPVAHRVLLLPLLVGKRYVTNAKGTVTIPSRDARVDLAIVRGKHVLSTMLLGRKGPRVFRFPPVSPVHVVVVNAAGSPVPGVPIRFLDETKTVSTDAEGRVTLARDLSVLQLVGQRKGVFAEVLAKSDVKHEFDPFRFQNSAADPVTLTVPALSSIEVEVRKKSGKGILTVWQVALTVPGGHTFLRRRAEKGKAVFPHVESGIEVAASCTIAGVARKREELVKAPAAGTSTVVRITVEDIPTVLDFRLIGLDGQPVRDEWVGTLLLSKKKARTDEVKTDAEGRMIFNLPHGMFAETEEVEFRLQRVRHVGSLGIFERALAAAFLGAYRAPLAAVRQLPPGWKLKLEKPNVVFSGRFVDEAGRPVQGVKLSIQANMNGERGNRVYFGRPMIVTGADGRFAFAELAPPREKIYARMRSYHRATRRLIFDAPALDVELRTSRVSKIRGSVAGIPKDQIPRVQVTAELQGPEAKRQKPRIVGVVHGGHFQIAGCLAGTYRLSFARSPGRQAFLVVDGVKVESGKDCKDPRLQSMDLSRFVRFLKVRVVDAKGDPLPKAWVRFGTEGELDARTTGRDGSTTFSVPGVAQVLVVELDGYREQRFKNVRKNLKVTLRR